MTSSKQDKEFIESVISDRLLEESIEWIESNLSPQDVFGEVALRDWAISNGFVEDIS